MFGKLIDGVLAYLRLPLHTYDGDIFTNDPELLIAHGWKEIIFTDEPEAPEGYAAVPRWVETETQIVQVWGYVEAQADEQDYISALEDLGVTPDD